MDQVLAVRAAALASGAGTPSCTISSPGCDLAAERRDLDHLGAELDVREPEAAADDPAVPEQLLDLIRMRRRADVEVLGPAPEQEVANAAADQIGDVVGLPQPVEHFQRVGVDVAARERVLRARNDPRFDHRRHCTKTPSEWRLSALFSTCLGMLIARVLPSRGMMRAAVVVVPPLVAGACPAAAAEPRDPLARARLLYNQRQFEAAVDRGRGGARCAGARRQRRSDRRARVPRAISRERGARRSDERARAAAPARSRAVHPARAHRVHRRPRRDAVLRRRARRGGGGVRSVLAAQDESDRRGARTGARLVGERARPRRAAAQRDRAAGGVSEDPRPDGDELAIESGQRDRGLLGRRPRRGARAICRPRGTRRRPAGCGRRSRAISGARCAPISIAWCCARSSRARADWRSRPRRSGWSGNSSRSVE